MEERAAVLVIGVDPARLDPAAWGAEQNAAVVVAIADAERRMHEAGYDVKMCLIGLDDDPEAGIVPRLCARRWDAVVIGGGLRHPPELLLVFERVVNAVHRHAPQAAIVFNTTPRDCLEAVARWVRPAPRKRRTDQGVDGSQDFGTGWAR